jgi:hypothetical protein
MRIARGGTKTSVLLEILAGSGVFVERLERETWINSTAYSMLYNLACVSR